MGDLDGELEQLKIIIDKYNKENHDNYHIQAASTLREQSEIEEAFEILNVVQEKVKKGLSLKSVDSNRDLEKCYMQILCDCIMHILKKDKRRRVRVMHDMSAILRITRLGGSTILLQVITLM